MEGVITMEVLQQVSNYYDRLKEQEMLSRKNRTFVRNHIYVYLWDQYIFQCMHCQKASNTSIYSEGILFCQFCHWSTPVEPPADGSIWLKFICSKYIFRSNEPNSLRYCQCKLAGCHSISVACVEPVQKDSISRMAQSELVNGAFHQNSPFKLPSVGATNRLPPVDLQGMAQHGGNDLAPDEARNNPPRGQQNIQQLMTLFGIQPAGPTLNLQQAERIPQMANPAGGIQYTGDLQQEAPVRNQLIPRNDTQENQREKRANPQEDDAPPPIKRVYREPDGRPASL